MVRLHSPLYKTTSSSLLFMGSDLQINSSDKIQSVQKDG